MVSWALAFKVVFSKGALTGNASREFDPGCFFSNLHVLFTLSHTQGGPGPSTTPVAVFPSAAPGHREFRLRLHGGPASFSLHCVLSVLLRPVFIGSSGQQSRDTSAELCRLHVQQPPAASAPNFPPNFFAHLPWMRGPDNRYQMVFSTIYNFCKNRIYVQLCNHLNHSVKFLCVYAGPRSFLSHAPHS